MRLAIVTTHPIQYYAPVFKMLAAKIEVMVFYTWGKASLNKHDPGFGKTIAWDIDLLKGYNYQWVDNAATDAGSHHFKGIDNPSLIKQITGWQPDAVLVYGWAYKSHIKVLRYFKNKIPVFFRGDSTLLDEKPGFKQLLKYLWLRRAYSLVDYAFYTGTNNKAYFKKYGLKENQLVFAPHAIDNARFAADRTEEALTLRLQLDIPADAIVILFAGKLEEKKDPGLLLHAYSKLTPPNVHLLFVGDGPLRTNLQQWASAMPNVHFMSFKNQQYMPVAYQACDIFCLPSKGPGETWGLAVNEAMACGKAVLVSDKVGCAADLVDEGQNGYIHHAANQDHLTAKLGHMLNLSKGQLQAMGKASAQKIAAWNFETQVNNMINILSEQNC